MTEQSIQKKITTYLKQQNIYNFKVISANKSGIPDIIALHQGKFISIEVKTPKTKNNTSKLQEYQLNQIKEHGGYSLVAYELQQVKDFINSLNG